MTSLVLYEDEGFRQFLPLLYWRSLFELRYGRDLLIDRAARTLDSPIAGLWTRDWIAKVAQQRCGAPVNVGLAPGSILANGRWLCEKSGDWPEAPCVGDIGGEVAFIHCDARLAANLTFGEMLDSKRREIALANVPRIGASGRMLHYPWDIVRGLADALTERFDPADAGMECDLDPRTVIESPDRVHIGRRAKVHPRAAISGDAGPVYISHDVTIGAFALVEGPCYIGPGSTVNPHAWLHGANSIGPVCKIGGEIDGCMIQGYSNKQHHGFLGHSHVGSWVNLGAGTTNSDLKNTYGAVRVPICGTEVDTGGPFFGAVIGDHVKTGINATIPTGAVLGFGANVMTSRIAPKFVPSLAWVTDNGVERGDGVRLLDVAAKVMARRNVELADEEAELFLDLGDRVKRFEPGP
jgi:UDP-N-acetylglucosamine diphosphorylase/glucosamine-1-phosphate N-acetyltransferase